MSRRFFFQYILLFTINFWFFSATAKEYPMLHYGLEEGLPSNTIYDIYQAPDGIIWIGTDKGVSRFNGIKFENLSTSDGLADNECFYFRPDQEGRLWIATYNGELCYYKDGIFHNAKNTPYLKLPKANYAREVKVLKEGSIAFYSARDPIIFLLDKSKMSSYSNPYLQTKSKTRKELLNIERLDSNKLKLYYQDELVILDADKIYSQAQYKTPLQNRVHTINQSYYVRADGKLLNESLQELSLRVGDKLKSHFIHRFIKTKGQEIVASDGGLFIDSLSAILPKEVIHTVIVDRAGDYWIGTKKSGLYLLSKDFISSQRIEQAYDAPIMFAHTNNGSLLLATEQGDLLRLEGDSTACVFNDNLCNTKYSDFSYIHIVKNKVINGSLFGGRYKYILFKETYGQINSHIQKASKSSRVNFDIEDLRKSIKSIIVTGSYVYFDSRYKIHVINRNDFFSKNHLYVALIEINNGTEAIFGFCKGLENDVWFSTLKSVYRVHDTIAILQPQFGSTSFREMQFLQKRLIGITHSNELLVCSEIKTKKVKIDTIRGENCIWEKLYPINDSSVLISSNNHSRLLSLYPSSPQLRYHIRVLENPLIPYQSEFIYTDSNNAYFFKKGALNSFPKNYLLQHQSLPTITIQSVSTEKKTNYHLDNLHLDYSSARNLKIHISPVSLYNQNLSYQYSISENKEADKWIDFEGEELNLVKMGFGSYTIKIRAKTLSGEHSAPATLTLNIGKPYWATSWFVALSLLTLVLIIALIAHLGIKRKLRKKEGEVRFLKSEYKAMNALMNPHFIFNSLNSVQSLVNNQENTTASKYIRTFSDLIRQNMHNIAQELIPLSKELNLIENYLQIEKLRFKAKLNYHIDIADNIETDLIHIPPLLIQPLVENAIKHGLWPKKSEDGLVSIKLYEQKQTLYIEVTDNGNGFTASNKSDTLHESYAMSNIHKRTEQLSQIHQTKIECTISELKDEHGTVIGVQSTITIDLNERKKP
jgi:two-component sensor histidine kinase